jgi:hypothetical protein
MLAASQVNELGSHQVRLHLSVRRAAGSRVDAQVTVSHGARRITRPVTGPDLRAAATSATVAGALALGADVTGPAALWLFHIGAASAAACVRAGVVRGLGSPEALQRLGAAAGALPTCAGAEFDTSQRSVRAVRRGSCWFLVEVGPRPDAPALVQAWFDLAMSGFHRPVEGPQPAPTTPRQGAPA